MAASLQYLPPSLHGLPLCVSVSTLPLFPLIRIQSLHLRPTLNPGWSHLEILNSSALAKILFPNKVTFAGAGVKHLRLAFGVGIIQPTTACKSILAHEGLVFLSVVHCSPVSEPAGPFPGHTGSQKHFTPFETTLWGWGPGICLLKMLPKWFLPSVWEPPYQTPENWNSSIYYSVNLPGKTACMERLCNPGAWSGDACLPCILKSKSVNRAKESAVIKWEHSDAKKLKPLWPETGTESAENI